MTPKETAKELVEKFINIDYLKHFEGMDYRLAKECALISLEEIKNTTLSLMKYFNEDRGEFEAIELDYLEEVKNYINSYENEL